MHLWMYSGKCLSLFLSLTSARGQVSSTANEPSTSFSFFFLPGEKWPRGISLTTLCCELRNQIADIRKNSSARHRARPLLQSLEDGAVGKSNLIFFFSGRGQKIERLQNLIRYQIHIKTRQPDFRPARSSINEKERENCNHAETLIGRE